MKISDSDLMRAYQRGYEHSHVEGLRAVLKLAEDLAQEASEPPSRLLQPRPDAVPVPPIPEKYFTTESVLSGPFQHPGPATKMEYITGPFGADAPL